MRPSVPGPTGGGPRCARGLRGGDALEARGQACDASDRAQRAALPDAELVDGAGDPCLAFVVTSSCRPSGAKPTWPGEVRKFGGSLLARPSERAEPAIGVSPCGSRRKPWTIPVPPALRTYARSPCTPTLAGNWPPEGTT